MIQYSLHLHELLISLHWNRLIDRPHIYIYTSPLQDIFILVMPLLGYVGDQLVVYSRKGTSTSSAHNNFLQSPTQLFTLDLQYHWRSSWRRWSSRSHHHWHARHALISSIRQLITVNVSVTVTVSLPARSTRGSLTCTRRSACVHLFDWTTKYSYTSLHVFWFAQLVHHCMRSLAGTPMELENVTCAASFVFGQSASHSCVAARLRHAQCPARPGTSVLNLMHLMR